MNFSTDNFFQAIDQMDPKKFAHFFHPGGSFTFANNPPSVGRENVAKVASSVFDLLKGISHNRTGTWTKGNLIFNEGRCSYHRKDNKIIEIPYFSIIEIKDDLIVSYRAYVDSQPLFGS